MTEGASLSSVVRDGFPLSGVIGGSLYSAVSRQRCSRIVSPLSAQSGFNPDKQVHLDPAQTTGGCIISPDSKHLGISDVK